jgi:hypothetical protein
MRGSYLKPRREQLRLDAIIDVEWPYFAENCDRGGQLDFYGMQALIVRTTAESGGGIVRLWQDVTPES